jgi:hypothetical protein
MTLERGADPIGARRASGPTLRGTFFQAASTGAEG